jgi:hypothetical protein
VVSFKKEAVIIPTDKLELARAKTKKAQDKNKYLIGVILILLGVIAWKTLI